MDGTDVSEQTNQSAVEETAPQGAAADVVATAVEVAEESTASAAEAGTVSEPAASSEDGELDAAGSSRLDRQRVRDDRLFPMVCQVRAAAGAKG